jgi:GTP pyrophosphokinase
MIVYCDDRAGMLREMTAVISDDGTNIRAVETKAGTEAEAIVEFVVDAYDVGHLIRLMNGLRRLPGVRDVQRQQKL